MAETTGPSWSDIPVDLAGRILRHLPAYVDRLRFAAVCPQWRAAARLGPLPPPLPLLLLSDSTVYSLPGSKPLHLLVPCCCTGYTDYEPDRCKLLFCSLDLVVAIVSLWSGRRLAVCKPGAATSWWYVSADGQYSDFVGMTFHQGKLYALTSMDELFAIEVSLDHSTGDPWVTQMRPVINNPPLFIPAEFFMETKVTYLVEARGALLMVLRKMQPCYAQGVTGIAIFETTAGVQNEFEVFQANFRKSQWTKVTTLGDDQILFLRQQCCESVCVSHDEVPGDCIFFLENEDEDRLWSKASSSSCSVYSMRDGKISTPLPTVSWKRGTVFATWLFPEN
nr:unnamed protein product [Digitaria exilis]